MQYAALMLRRWSPAVKSELGMDGAEEGAEGGQGGALEKLETGIKLKRLTRLWLSSLEQRQCASAMAMARATRAQPKTAELSKVGVA